MNKLLEEVAGQAWKVDEDDLALFHRSDKHGHGAGCAPSRRGHETPFMGDFGRTRDADMRLEGARVASLSRTFLGMPPPWRVCWVGWCRFTQTRACPPRSGQCPARMQRYSKIAEQLGFSVSKDTRPLLSVTRGVVKGAIEYGNGLCPGVWLQHSWLRNVKTIILLPYLQRELGCVGSSLPR